MKSRELGIKIRRRLAKYAGEFHATCQRRLADAMLMESGLSSPRSVFTHLTNAELDCLYHLASGLKDSAGILEIGSYLGASSRFLAAGVAKRGGRLYCVDTWMNETMPDGQKDTFLEFERNVADVRSWILPIRKNSAELTEADLTMPVDMVFIDGDHSYAAVKRDYELVAPWIREGQLLVFHDCTYFQSVSRLLGEVLASGGWQLGGNVDSLVWLRKVGEEFRFPNGTETSD